VGPAAAPIGPGIRIVGITDGDPRYEQARELRYDCLYGPWGLPWELVEDTDRRSYEHIIAIDGAGAVVGYARIHLEAGESKVYQVAVARETRGVGIGSALMGAAVERARAAGRDFVELDARDYALGFYERLGFVEEGEPFVSGRTGTPHRRMRLVLGTYGKDPAGSS
jgi:predicted GNAT family N-acyltransferase